jgi:hypothetical protein
MQTDFHLHRVFVQSRIDRQFGWITAIFDSRAKFSLYHLVYLGVRTWEDILLLFAVGMGFAAVYRLSDYILLCEPAQCFYYLYAEIRAVSKDGR